MFGNLLKQTKQIEGCKSFSVVYAHKYLTNFQITPVDNQFSILLEYSNDRVGEW